MTPPPLLKIRPRQSVVFRTTPSGGFLLDIDSGRCFQLNRIGAEIWSLALGDEMTVSKTMEALCQKYGITPEVADADVQALLEEILQAGLADPIFCLDEGASGAPT
jgi:hypothetical protein